MNSSKKRVICIWGILCSAYALSGFMLHIINPEYDIVLLFLYFTVLILGKLSLPVLVNPLSGWGWSEPNALGWTLATLVWIGVFFVIASLIAQALESKSRQ